MKEGANAAEDDLTVDQLRLIDVAHRQQNQLLFQAEEQYTVDTSK